MIYPYWNCAYIPDDYGNMIISPNIYTKLWAIQNLYLPYEWH
jgi:hypothetical protein